MSKKKKKNIFGKIIIVLLIIGLIVGGIAGKYWYQNYKIENIEFEEDSVKLFIPKGSTQQDVLAQIIKLNIVSNSESLMWLAEQKNYKGALVVSGNYIIKSGWTNNQLINHLRAGNGRIDANISFANVRTLKNLADSISEGILLESDAIYAWLKSKDSIRRYGFKEETIISMFIPNTYRVDYDITVPDLMKRMAREYKTFWNSERVARLKDIQLSQSEATTLASIVFSETNSTRDMKTIAGVYMNRINKGWPLQADPTLIFALNDYTIKRVLNKHKKVDSPYNTYMYKGLPPGPINIPPSRYIDAVLNYEKHKYMFFCAKEDFSGDSNFARTLAGHMVNARRYQKALNDRKIYE
jgi:UPF0755 protein